MSTEPSVHFALHEPRNFYFDDTPGLIEPHESRGRGNTIKML